MSSVSGISPLSTVRVLQGGTPTTAKVEALVADTEYSYTFPTGTRRFKLLSTTCADIKIGTAAGNIALDDYWPVDAGNVYEEDFLNLSGLTLYLTSSKDNDIIRIISWK